ncbi:MAG: hybrid sensor histidine kinase/response regulator [Woronichinia naegeliana WA131]|jgi:CheY-like chemotaxis protein/two-component sensor histidine kinase|uniref:histidine kinase n=1 Tax=Woronichinia naegeliana WA131 TaxID=2824559 RepID=A0A977KU91_9CYAN|nr:MAG: hybrid sensor histidine kinase/response regulator [Woronichinia naegeliana WA131]
MNVPSIFVIDDEPDNFDVIETFLSDADYQLHYAASGQEALILLNTFSPDLILLDVMMPGLDGIEVCQQLKAKSQWQAIPIIMVTALTSKEDLSRCLEAGADDFISKPVNRFELRARVKSMLRIKQQYDRIQEFSVIQRDTINILGQNLEELTGNLAVSLSHELNTPLNGIIGVIEVLKDNIQDMEITEVREILSWADQSANRLNELTKKFLLYLQLEITVSQHKDLGTAQTRFSAADIKMALEIHAKSYERNKDLKFELKEATLSLPEKYLSILLKELVDNALKYSACGTEIQIKSQIIDGMLNISIHDWGRGMTAYQISRIDAFRQFERKEHQQPGIGIGLKIVMKIVQLAGGHFSIQSVYKRETKVTISLPIIGN